MFGVTTSDDYRPVAWMGRYPVDVTTMLVGVHVAAAILAAIHCDAIVGCWLRMHLAIVQFDSAAHLVQAGRSGGLLLMRSFMSRHQRCSGSRSRCTCCSYSGEKWNVFSVDALI